MGHHRTWTALGAGIALALGGWATAAGAADGERSLAGISQARVGAALPAGWQVRPVRGSSAPASRVVEDPRLGAVIRFEAVDQAAFFGFELPHPLDAGAGRLRWSWRVDEPIPDAALRDAERDDAPARFFVIFGRRGLLTPPRMIFYTWGNRETRGDAWPSRASRRMHVVVLRNAGDPVGRWVTEERDLAADFRAAFGGEPPPVAGVGWMIDTEELGTRAVGLLGPVTWRPAP